MEQEHLHDPLRFQYVSSTRRFSLCAKILAIILVFIFMLIPLYHISPDAFKANYVQVPVDCPQTLNCGCHYVHPYSL